LNLLEQISANLSADQAYEPDNKSLVPLADPLVRLIAFYLPQFHAIAENDEWWGEGFTEWTNVTKAVPRFTGHYQPRLPGALGFYDAARPEILARQAEMAKRYGVAGFCFHHYWFGGRRVLEKPLEMLLAHPEIDLPFCVNWANENWTKRWDGKDSEILLEQRHSADDDLAFARSLEPLFRDKRYIRIDGRPLFLVYRPSLFPNMRETVERWRGHFKATGFGDPYIVTVQTHGSADPSEYGMDAAAGFPPFWTCFDIPMRNDLEFLDPRFYGAVRHYALLADSVIAGYAQDRRVFPGITPSWDNEARRPGRPTCFSGSTPALYGRWLRAACAASMRAFAGDERLVFVNAWNEWAEGAYLEPDLHFGFAYLAETRRILDSLTPDLADNPPSTVMDRSWEVPKLGLSRRLRRRARKAVNVVADGFEQIAWKLRGR